MGILIGLILISPFLVIGYFQMSPEERKAWKAGKFWEYQESQKRGPILLLALPKRFDPNSQEYMDRYSPKI